MMRLRQLGPLMILLTLCGAARAEHGIQILDAVYGRSGRACDATHAVARQCDGQGRCLVVASNHLCGDPVKGKIKELVVNFSCGQGNRRSQAVEGDELNIQCRLGRPMNSRSRGRGTGLTVHEAIYGAGRKYCDASRYFRHGCGGRRSCSLLVGNQMCGDPFKGKKKRVDIQYQCGDHSYEASFRENQHAVLNCQ